MDKQLKEFFCDEVERRHLDFETFPEYNSLIDQCLSLFPDGDLPKPVFDLIETANCISFAHGLKLGLRLKRWAKRPLWQRGSARRAVGIVFCEAKCTK